jgi:hypothetical protein
MKAMEKDRNRRYATANGLALDVERFLEKEVVLARPPSPVYKLRKLIQRNKLAFIGLSLIFLLLVVALAVTSRLTGGPHPLNHEAHKISATFADCCHFYFCLTAVHSALLNLLEKRERAAPGTARPPSPFS